MQLAKQLVTNVRIVGKKTHQSMTYLNARRSQTKGCDHKKILFDNDEEQRTLANMPDVPKACDEQTQAKLH